MKKPVRTRRCKSAEYLQMSEMVGFFQPKCILICWLDSLVGILSDTTLKLGRSTIEPLHMNLYAIKLYDQAVPADGLKI